MERREAFSPQQLMITDVAADCKSARRADAATLGSLVLALAAGIWFALATSSFAAAAPYSLDWNTNRNRVTADIKSVELLKVLQRVARVTGWQIYIEPQTLHTSVSAKFRDLQPGEALRFLLGDMNYALLPGTNSRTRLFVFRTGQENATQLVRGVEPERGKRIPNEIIVRLKPGANIDEIARKLGAKVVGRIDRLNAYRLQFTDEAAADIGRAQLALEPDVTAVDNNYEIDRFPPLLGGQGGASAPQLQMRPPPATGRVIVGLVDTAVQPLGNNLDQFLMKQVCVAGPAQLDPSTPTHGTAMAETMLNSLQQVTGGSTSVQILPVDVYGASDSTSTFNVANGIIQAVNGGARVINLSLGSPEDSPFLHEVVMQAQQSGILLISAAGNEPVTAPYYPAAYPEVRAVTAIDQGQLAPYANRGSFVSLAAPGLSLVPFGPVTWGVQGTSVSSATVSGAVAGYMDASRSSLSQAQSFLQNNFGVRISGGR